jgi:hypothetical protein
MIIYQIILDAGAYPGFGTQLAEAGISANFFIWRRGRLGRLSDVDVQQLAGRKRPLTQRSVPSAES